MKKRTVLVVLGIIGITSFSLVLLLGFWLGPHAVRQIISGSLEVSQPADTQRTREISGRHFSMQYPGNWKLDTADPHYDLNKYFDIDAPGPGQVVVNIVGPHVTPQQGVDVVLMGMKKLLVERKQTFFESWGSHKGYGVQLEGFFTFGGEGFIRAFGLGNSQTTVVITEHRFNETEANNSNGFDLIAQTFELKEL